MSEFRARISRVRLKDGADVHVLRNRVADEGGEDWRGAIIRNARRIADTATDQDPLAGYVVLGLFESGSASIGFRYNFESHQAMPRMMIPTWVAEILRRDLIANEEAREVFHEMFEWQEGY